jgi:hypothetical protein
MDELHNAMTPLTSRILAASVALLASGGVLAFEPTMSVTSDNSLRPILFGTTNLPNGTQLMVALVKQRVGYAGMSQATVVGGHFATEQFTDDDRPLPPGEYLVDVQMVLGQSDQVRAVIGDHGQNMSGPLVVKVLTDNTVSYRATLQIGGASGNDAALAAYQAAIAAKVERVWIRPPGIHQGINCQVRITQVPGGGVTAVQVGSCNGDDTVRQSISDAAYRASPLPAPSDPALFDTDVVVTFAPHY